MLIMLQFKFFQPESFRTVPAVMQTSIFDGIDRLMHLMYRVVIFFIAIHPNFEPINIEQ